MAKTPKPEAAEGAPAGRWQALGVLSTACFLGMTCWFSASAVLPQLRKEWALDAATGALLTIAVQLGFVLGSLVSAVFNVPDLVPPRRLVLFGALGSALANGGLVLTGGPEAALPLRFLTGAALAYVYPPSLKAVATWFRRDRGTALGVMIGALTLGSALPHLLNALGGVQWRSVILATSALTLLGGLVAEYIAKDGPYPFPRATFNPRQAFLAFRNPGVRLASIGYFGHMWELYAMWAWIAPFFSDVLRRERGGDPSRLAALCAFGIIGIGSLGCWVAGRMGDRWGRARTASLAMLCSGACALCIGWEALPFPAVLLLGLVWGFWVVADSAQFSTIVTEVAEQSYVGTALTLQLAVGFTLTVLTIWLVPVLREQFGWQWALASLALGPVAGIASMLRLIRVAAMK